MESESHDDAHEHKTHARDEEDVLKAFNLPAESAEQIDSTNVSASHIAGYQGEPDPEGKDLMVEETESGEVGSNTFFNTQELHSSTNQEHIDPVEDAKQLNPGTTATESYLQHQVHDSQGSDRNRNSHAQHLNNQPEDAVSSLFAEEPGLENGRYFGGEYDGLNEESNEQVFDPDTQDYRFDDDNPPPEEIDLQYQDTERDHTQTNQNTAEAGDDPEAGGFQSYRRNPFDDLEDPESGDGFFGSQIDDLDNRPDPESQGYSLLQDDEDPEGIVRADVHNAKEGHIEDKFNRYSLSPQQREQSTDKVNAFFQVQGSISESVSGLEIVAHQLVDPSNPVRKGIESESSAQHDKGFEDKWFGSSENDQDFNFGGAEDQSNIFNSNKGGFPEFSQQLEQDPFAEIVQSNRSQSQDPFGPADESETNNLFDNESFAKLFPTPHTNPPPHRVKEPPPPSVPAPVNSLFGESPDVPTLFSSPDSFPTAPIKDTTPEETPSTGVPGTSEGGVVSDDILVTDDLDDLDFIDDSEFMAAFGATAAETPSSRPTPVQSIGQPNGSSQIQNNRYLPQQAPLQPPQNQFTPKQTYTQPTETRFTPQTMYAQPTQTQFTPQPGSQPSTTQFQPTTLTSNIYTPSAAPRPGVPTVSTTQSSQTHATQTTWSQPTAPRPPPPTQIPSSVSSSFVTAKGAYSSPYDLPPQITTKPKRHIPPPIPTYLQPPQGDIRPPLSANIRPSLSRDPPPRAASAQSHFPPHQQQYLPPQRGVQGPPSQYAPPDVSSPPLRSPPIQGARQYDPRRVVSPPLPRSTQDRQLSQSLYAPRRDFSPPLQQSPRDVKFPPPTPYTPGTAHPPHVAQAAGQMYAPERAISPPSHRPPPGTQYQSIPVSRLPPQTVSPPSERVLSNRYTAGQKLVPPSVSAQPTRSTTQSALQGSTQNMLQYGQPHVSSLSSQQPHTIHQQTQQAQHAQRGHIPEAGTQAPPAMQMIQPPFPPSNLGPSFQHQHQHQLQHQRQPPFIPSQDTFYPTAPAASSHFEEDPHADLPPHFAMESGEYDQVYDTEGLTGPPMQFTERNIMSTPEPMDGHQPESFNDVSPPRPWERASTLGDYPSPPRTRPFSPYDPRGSIPPPAQVPPQSTIEPNRNVSLQVARTSISSPRNNMIPERSLSYPSRKAPHIRVMNTPSAPRTQEEDFQFRREGCPVVNFGFGGRMITMIPRTPHRVNVRGIAPISVPGMITFSSLREFTEPPGLASSFPGPLHSANKPIKGKAKDIGKWLDDNLALLDQLKNTTLLEDEDIKRIEDRSILYKLVKLLVDNNGVLDGNPELEKSVKEILLPRSVNVITEEGSQSFGITASSLATSMTAQSSTPDPNAIATYNLTTDFLRSMRSLLMQGDRQNAIRKAIDHKMWGHALLIASSVNQTVWRETVEQFIRSELRDTGTKDFDNLRFLYGVLGGEGLDAVNELLPPMNRMVSSIHPSATLRTPRVGSWKESLGIVLVNQGSMDTAPALIGLGSSLVSEGRIEAGHACFLLTKFAAKFSALDAPDTNYSVVGADHLYGKGSYVGLPQILLSEIVEYSQSRFVPEGFLHLLPYKLWHTWTLIDYGYFDIAEKYCESIGTTLQKEKGSIFITPTLIAMLRELTERMSESSHPEFSEKSSWFSGKKSTRGEYFWRALETNLTKFVAGDEASEDSTSLSNVKKPVDVQDPRFGRIASDTSLNRMASLPNLRAQASTPIYGQFPAETMHALGMHSKYSTPTSESRYTPGVRYEQPPVSPIQEHDMGQSTNAPSSTNATPDIPNRGYSPYVPLTQPHPPERVYSPYAPAPATPVEEEEEPEDLEGTVVRQGQETEESDKAAKEKGKEKEEEEKLKDRENEKEKEKKPAAEKSGWFGGWFRRGTSEPPEGSSTTGKPIKAKLGEESSFVYDTNLKRWVNKKAGDVPTKPTPAPPPPKRPASKAPSTGTPPGPAITSHTTVPPQLTTAQPPAPTPSVSATPPAKEVPRKDPVLPPSRPTSTALPPPGQTVDPLEALLSTRSVSGARGVKKPTRSRYVDVMNKK